MSNDKNKRIEALRSRVRSKLAASKKTSRDLPEVNEEEEVIVKVEPQKLLETNILFEDDDSLRIRRLASTLILIGSIMGMITGGLILQGNPNDLLTSSVFNTADSITLIGSVLDENGSDLENVTIELIDPESGIVIQETVTDRYGMFTFQNVIVKNSMIKASKTGHITVERIFIPHEVGSDPITLNSGDGLRKEVQDEENTGWTLENAVSLSIIIGFVTIVASLIGIHASVEARRGSRYRRTQYLAGFAMFGRGLIIFGPILILAGMGLLMMAKEHFEDQQVD